MKPLLPALLLTLGVLCLTGCAGTSVKQTWKAPGYRGGPVQKIAVVAVEERGLVRLNLERRFVRDLSGQGQAIFPTYETLTLPEIKADKMAAAARLRAAGATAVLILRLVDQATYSHEVRAVPERWVPTVSGFGTYGWHDYASVSFMDMSSSWGSVTQKAYLDTSLFDLQSGQRLWSALTVTTVKDDTDRLAEADALVGKIVQAMRQDGVVR